MKFLFILAVLLSSVVATAQKPVKKDSLGNYISVVINKTEDKETGKFFIDSKGVKYPIRKSVNGKLYYNKTAKSGNVYRVYIKEQN